MKIVHICLCGVFTDEFNYQENILSKYHKKMGLDVTIIASQWAWGKDGKKVFDDTKEFINKDGVKIIRIPTKKGTVDNRLKIYPTLSDILESENPDILFIHGCQFLDIVFTIKKFMKKHPNVKAYADNHADFSNSATNWFSKNILHKCLWRFCAKSVEPYIIKFYGVLPARVDFLKDLYKLPENKCELLVMGADDEYVEKASDEDALLNLREQYRIKKDDFLIVTGGKIDKWKTQTILLMEAVQSIKNEKVKLIVFGSVDDELKESVNNLTDGTKVQNIGWINANDSYGYFAAADLVVFPGRHSIFWEQVAAQGIPMLCKEWDGTKHVDVGGNVEFLTQDSTEEIQSAIEDLINNSEKYKKMKDAAVREGMKSFSYREIAKRAIE